eukprot:CAMPEP_0183301872 /NCGR_PEP_ID=MMETSP0160_2-20130417/7852_1 /TAXON_ID=2839 ORGANISM="Odontella Sinensis, Strain Grunow 1884" /NCGR_SAMPLE_ID=MMETSP0160_2 /ASSEMBLY_ACC=CAM_ASM_000250 /LENGTH=187 /DNA_ID=CAMNT_0025464569 /DNA_START=540 /DNA_END=1103 /DNA_ORIENTATION=+
MNNNRKFNVHAYLGWDSFIRTRNKYVGVFCRMTVVSDPMPVPSWRSGNYPTRIRIRDEGHPVVAPQQGRSLRGEGRRPVLPDGRKLDLHDGGASGPPAASAQLRPRQVRLQRRYPSLDFLRPVEDPASVEPAPLLGGPPVLRFVPPKRNEEGGGREVQVRSGEHVDPPEAEGIDGVTEADAPERVCG